MPTTGTIANPRVWATGSIASGATQSNDVNLMGYWPSAFDFSSGWDASNPTYFRVSNNATTWFDLRNSSGALYTFASGVLVSATGYSITPHPEMALALVSHQWLRVCSSAALSTGVSFTVQLSPL